MALSERELRSSVTSTGECDVCGMPATHRVIDVTRFDGGDGYFHHKVTGQPRTRCDSHPTESRTFDTMLGRWLDGAI